jgi:hypothetical protein
MKPILGWTMLLQDDMRQVERLLAKAEQDTRDEIGFLLIHQGFADRFFPGTSVLHTRIRYALFVPWIYRRAIARRRGTDLDAAIRRLLIELAIRLKRLGKEPQDVIGGDKLGQLTSQPPDRVYWTALRSWGILLPSVDSRFEALRRLRAQSRSASLDDDGGQLDEETTEVFAGMPDPPTGWDEEAVPLHFKLPPAERDFLRRKLSQLSRPDDTARSLLARLVEAGFSISDKSLELPKQLDTYADPDDKRALDVARDAAALAAIGRTVYGALVEHLLALDGGPDHGIFREMMNSHFAIYGNAAERCDLDALERLFPNFPPHVRDVLRETSAYVRRGKPQAFLSLRGYYQTAELNRKSYQRARLLDSERSAQRRAEWDPERHNTTPLHYRWRVVRQMLEDLGGTR